MKQVIIIAIFLLYALSSFAQEKLSILLIEKNLKHEIRISSGVMMFPNDKEWIGGFTANYMYRVVKWFWVGANINWQFPSDTEYYRWREYNIDGAFKDFIISGNNKFFAIAPEFRFSFTNTKWATLYSSFSAGYGMYTGITEIKPSRQGVLLKDYCYWNITLFGGNFHIGKKHNVFVGGEFGLGFKGVYAIHCGYRF